jgi:peptidyl-prolyl cis-trans isomerase SurA
MENQPFQLKIPALMKKLCLLVILAGCASPMLAQSLFTYGNNAVEKEEFLRAYNKNKTAVPDKEKAMREYLDLYVKFKLKVKAAHDLRLDTVSQLKYDLANFKAQIEESYMNDDASVNALVDEAFLRSQEDLHVIHFFAPMEGLRPEDTAKAWKAMNEVSAQMNSGNNDHDRIAKTLSATYVPVRSGDLGFITVFSLPYDYENIIYSLKTGETSKPYRTAKGVHVFKLIDKRASKGRWRIAQILFAVPPGDDAVNIPMVKKKADSVYNLLKQGADFSTLAQSYSDDKMTYMTGGEMPEFGTGKFDPAFENEVFRLQKESDISRPFLSPYGFHIIKKIKQTPTPASRDDANYLSDLKQKVLQDNRVNVAKANFFKNVMKQLGYKKLNTVKDAELFRYADSVSAHLSTAVSKDNPVYDKPIFMMAKATIKGGEWLDYVFDYKTAPEMYKGESNEVLFDQFTKTTLLNYYKKNLEELNPDFKYQMDEFRDGNVLFEIMERNVWSSAGADSTALIKHYNQNKAKYKWAASASIIVFNCSNKTVADEAYAAIRSGKNWKKLVEDKNTTVMADSGRYELSQIPIDNAIVPAPGLITKPIVNSIDGSASFIMFLDLYEAGLPRSFEEARGLVINDYQLILEEQWIDSLKKKYPVKINEAVFASLLK